MTDVVTEMLRPRCSSRTEMAFAVVLAVVAPVLMAWFALRPGMYFDWGTEARPAVDALVAGHVLRFLQLAPVYGGSLILRAPFVMVTTLWRGQEDSIYRASTVPCLLAAAVLGLYLCARQRVRGGSRFTCMVTLLLCVASPMAYTALHWGHAEEILGAALCVAAVMCAVGGRPTWAAVVLGLAVANKESAILAVGPVLVALPRARCRSLVISGAVAGAVLAPLVLAGRFAGSAASVGLTTGSIFQPWQIWWWFGSVGPGQIYRSAPAWVGSLGHTLPVALMPPLTALYAWRAGERLRRRPSDALLLLALLMGLRCVLDPWDISYYSFPLLVALLSWEALTFARPPVLTLAATVAAWYIFHATSFAGYNLPPDAQALVFTLVSIPSLLVLGAAVYAPGLAGLITRRVAWPRRPRGAQATAS